LHRKNPELAVLCYILDKQYIDTENIKMIKSKRKKERTLAVNESLYSEEKNARKCTHMCMVYKLCTKYDEKKGLKSIKSKKIIS
jgi:hypothetical protein